MSLPRATRSATLALYRSCLRSVKRIPDGGHRVEYQKYVREGFREKARLYADSAPAIAAIEDAREQLERMNYFHSIREEKEKEKKNKGTTATETAAQTEATARRSIATGGNDTATTATTAKPPTDNTLIHQWLTKALPKLSEQDRDHYTSCLVEDGFDTIELLTKDLLPEEDLGFMKKAHQRAIIRTYFSGETSS